MLSKKELAAVNERAAEVNAAVRYTVERHESGPARKRRMGMVVVQAVVMNQVDTNALHREQKHFRKTGEQPA